MFSGKKFICACLSAALLPTIPSFAAEVQKPNVLLVFSDQHRADAMHYEGDPYVQTPNFDKMAQEGVVLSNMISPSPVCSPARASLLTGIYPHDSTVFTNEMALDPDSESIGKVFKRDGYETAYVGKWHIDGYGRETAIPAPRRQGFDYWKVHNCEHNYLNGTYYDENNQKQSWGSGVYEPIAQTDSFFNFLDNRDKSRPFFGVLAWGVPHDPYDRVPQKYLDIYKDMDITLPPNVPAVNQAISLQYTRGYYSNITALDEQMGRVDAYLKANGLEDNTIVIYTSDHGDLLYSHGYGWPQMTKLEIYDEAARVPFIIKYPNSYAGKKIANPYNLTDIMPTLLEMAGLQIPQAVEGVSFKGVMDGTKTPAFDGTLYQWSLPARESGELDRGYITERYTYRIGKTGKQPRLFDNSVDPYQMNNLAGNPAYAQLQQDMDAKMRQIMARVNDNFETPAQIMARIGVTSTAYTIDQQPIMHWFSNELYPKIKFANVYFLGKTLAYINGVKTRLEFVPRMENGKFITPQGEITDYIDPRGMAISGQNLNITSANADELISLSNDPYAGFIADNRESIYAPRLPQKVYQWDFKSGIQNWTSSPQAALTWQNSEYLKVAISGGDPYIICTENYIDTGEVNALKITYKNLTASPTLEVRWRTSTGVFDNNSIAISALKTNMTSFETLIVPLTNAYWTGTQSFIRLDPTSALSTGEFYIDQIDLINYVPVVPKVDETTTLISCDFDNATDTATNKIQGEIGSFWLGYGGANWVKRVDEGTNKVVQIHNVSAVPNFYVEDALDITSDTTIVSYDLKIGAGGKYNMKDALRVSPIFTLQAKNIDIPGEATIQNKWSYDQWFNVKLVLKNNGFSLYINDELQKSSGKYLFSYPTDLVKTSVKLAWASLGVGEYFADNIKIYKTISAFTVLDTFKNRYSIINNSANGKAFVAVLAKYDGNKLISTSIRQISLQAGEISTLDKVEFNKLLLFESFENIKPLRESINF